MTMPPSGNQFAIAAAGYEAVVTECGATLRTLTYDGQDVVAGFAEDAHASSGRGQLLLPWPNRIAAGKYTFGGRQHQLPLTEVGRGNASHGLVRWVSWSVLDHADDSVGLGYRLMAQAGYPWTLDLEARYALSDSGLTVIVSATNRSTAAAPFAAGAHPFLTVGPGPVDGWHLRLPASTALDVDERMIPTGRRAVGGTDLDFREGRQIGTTSLDTAFTNLSRGTDGNAEVTVSNGDLGVTVWMDESYPWVQVFAGVDDAPRSILAVEPMTSPPDAFNSGEDLVVLSPSGEAGDQHIGTWGIRAQAGAT